MWLETLKHRRPNGLCGAKQMSAAKMRIRARWGTRLICGVWNTRLLLSFHLKLLLVHYFSPASIGREPSPSTKVQQRQMYLALCRWSVCSSHFVLFHWQWRLIACVRKHCWKGIWYNLGALCKLIETSLVFEITHRSKKKEKRKKNLQTGVLTRLFVLLLGMTFDFTVEATSP